MRRFLAVGTVLVLAGLNAPEAMAAAAAPGPIVTGANGEWAPTGSAGWKRDFYDNFTSSLNTKTWGRYNGKSTSSSLGSWVPENVVVQNQNMTITTVKRNGVWTTGGVSSGPGAVFVQGQWLVRAKFDKAPGVGYGFLLWPDSGGWPPEVDFAEGAAGTTRTEAAFHWGTNHQIQKRYEPIDLTKWHTYGVMMHNNTLAFVIDGKVWYQMEHASTPWNPMWLGLQANPKPCDGINYQCVTTATPSWSQIHIDWVAHYRWAG